MFIRRPVLSLIVVALVAAAPAHAQEKASTARGHTNPTGLPTAAAHRVAIHVDDNDARAMNLALNNSKNIVEYYRARGETVAIEIVTYGPGLHMLRMDTSPVRQRIEEMSLSAPEVSFTACGNTQAKMARAEGKDVPLLSEAHVVASGVVRLMELQEQGYSYIRPSGRQPAD